MNLRMKQQGRAICRVCGSLGYLNKEKKCINCSSIKTGMSEGWITIGKPSKR